MSRCLDLASGLYFLTHVWMRRYRVEGFAELWECASGHRLMRLGFIDAGGEILYQG